jgi:cyclic-di-GMP-binding protein
MPSFDIVSEVDMHEVTNAVDQTNREAGNRFDFKGTDSRVEHNETLLTIHSDTEFQVGQILDILHKKLAKRGVNIAALEEGTVESRGNRASQAITVRQGIDQDTARKLIKLIKESRLSLQGSIQGDKVRVSGKNRDDLQRIISTLRNAGLGLPLQFINFRD